MSFRPAVPPRALRVFQAVLVACLLGAIVASAVPGNALTQRAAGSWTDYRVALPGYRWAPCGTIDWKYNPDGQPVRMLPVLRAAFRQASRLTGLKFHYEGSTARSAARFSGSVASTEVLISWATPRQSAALAGSRVGSTRTYADPLSRRYESAAVVFDGTARDVRPGFSAVGRATWGQVALHEIGHVLGLAHAAGRNELMNPVLGASNHRLGAGDLAGFRRVGRHRDC